MAIPGSHSGPEERAVAMESALAPLSLGPAGLSQISIRSCLAAVDVVRGCQSPRDSGTASVCVERGERAVGTRVHGDISVLKANFWSRESLLACVLPSVRHGTWLSVQSPWLHPHTGYLAPGTAAVMKE